jgi:hypothetical protein
LTSSPSPRPLPDLLMVLLQQPQKRRKLRCFFELLFWKKEFK